jgi:hypothetical protein
VVVVVVVVVSDDGGVGCDDGGKSGMMGHEGAWWSMVCEEACSYVVATLDEVSPDVSGGAHGGVLCCARVTPVATSMV